MNGNEYKLEERKVIALEGINDKLQEIIDLIINDGFMHSIEIHTDNNFIPKIEITKKG